MGLSAGGDLGGLGAPGVGDTAAGAAALEGASWRLARYAGLDGAERTVLAGTEITARFEGGRLSGAGGCNRYMAGYTLRGEAIEIDPPASTMMACPEPEGVMEQEAAYLAALSTASHYRIEGDRLLLQTASGARVASFVPATAPAGAIPPRAGG